MEERSVSKRSALAAIKFSHIKFFSPRAKPTKQIHLAASFFFLLALRAPAAILFYQFNNSKVFRSTSCHNFTPLWWLMIGLRVTDFFSAGYACYTKFILGLSLAINLFPPEDSLVNELQCWRASAAGSTVYDCCGFSLHL